MLYVKLLSFLRKKLKEEFVNFKGILILTLKKKADTLIFVNLNIIIHFIKISKIISKMKTNKIEKNNNLISVISFYNLLLTYFTNSLSFR
jgi:hypothetical protein